MADLRAPEAKTEGTNAAGTDAAGTDAERTDAERTDAERTDAERDVRPSGRAPSAGERVPEPRLAIAEVPEWVIQRIDRVAYPTRMARRRALEAARTVDGWQPDAAITAPLLDQVAVTLVQMPDTEPQPRLATVERADGAVGDSLGPERGPDGRLLTKSQRRMARRNPPQPQSAPIPPSVPQPASFDTLPADAGRRRLPRRLIAGVTLAGVAVCGTVVAVLGRADGTRSADAPAAAVLATQQVLAVAFVRQGQVTGVSLLASGSAEPQQVLVPSRLLLDVPGAGRIPVGQSLGPGASAPGAALGDALEIRVAGTWALSTVALAQLVDDVGGVQVDVDVDVTQGTAVGAPILVAAGPAQRLTGALAAEYAQLLVGEEPEASRLDRQAKVLTAVLARLPADAARRRTMLAALPGTPTGATLDGAVAMTGALRSAASSSTLASTVLPVRDIDTGGPITAYGLDSAATATLVKTRLAGAALPTPDSGRLRVLVQNGVGTPGLGEVARVRLVAAGLMYVGGGNVEGFAVTESVILLPDGTAVSRARGMTVARALGLPDSALRISDNTSTVVDAVVVLGTDFSAS